MSLPKTPFKCTLSCQHHGQNGGAHLVPGGEFALKKLRNHVTFDEGANHHEVPGEIAVEMLHCISGVSFTI